MSPLGKECVTSVQCQQVVNILDTLSRINTLMSCRYLCQVSKLEVSEHFDVNVCDGKDYH